MGRPRELGLSVRPSDLRGHHPLPKPLLGSLLPPVQGQALSGLICLLAMPLCSSHPCQHLLPAFKGHFPPFHRVPFLLAGWAASPVSRIRWRLPLGTQ